MEGVNIAIPARGRDDTPLDPADALARGRSSPKY